MAEVLKQAGMRLQWAALNIWTQVIAGQHFIFVFAKRKDNQEQLALPFHVVVILASEIFIWSFATP